ncbi:hypothetical protein QR680_013260 [Steinernema hermaphroditum]|uniref:Uncharacterized protein n=1 Tax=Steinernema hermaphroditum TaxID=289476 RepID=A0AA39M193_9BILA|nr:hypothetical protein QR680_013260 [Steinernema hermaphroditum]
MVSRNGTFDPQEGGRVGAFCVPDDQAPNGLIASAIDRTTMSTRISVTPSAPTLLDADVRVVVSGLRPKQVVRITLTLLHPGAQFQSFAKFEAPDDGVVALAETPSFEGTYTGVDAMGLFSSMCLLPSQRFGSVLSLGNVEGLLLSYQLHVYDEKGRLLGQHTLQKFVLDLNVERREIAAGNVRGVLFKPRGPPEKRFPSVIDLFGLGGGCREHRAALLAQKGFAVLALGLYNYRDLPRFNTRVNIEYMKESIDWLRSQPFASPRCAIVGHSLGAIVGYQALVRYPGVCSIVALNGLPHIDCTVTMLEKGRPLPSFLFRNAHVTHAKHEGNVSFYRGMWERILDEEADEVAKYRIPLESVPDDVAFMVVTGEQDETQPYKRINEELVARLRKANPRRRVDAVFLRHSGHMLDVPHTPHVGVAYTPPSYWAQGGHQYLQCVDQRRLWPQMVAFLRDTIPVHVSPGSKL